LSSWNCVLGFLKFGLCYWNFLHFFGTRTHRMMHISV
jgi:hypothetical protein